MPNLRTRRPSEILAKVMDHCIVHIDISPRVSLLIYCGQKNVFTKYIKYHNVCYLLKKFFEFIGTIRFLNIIIIFFFIYIFNRKQKTFVGIVVLYNNILAAIYSAVYNDVIAKRCFSGSR